MSDRMFRTGVALVMLLALLIRVAFLLGLEVQTHVAGDINDYLHYAWNLGHHAVYSSASPDTVATPAPDGFRPPGYPMFLLLCMWLGGFGSAWLAWAHALQILASSATVLLVTLLGRTWMKPGPSLLSGVLLALWPHHVVFASTLLSETLLGFSVVLAMWLASVAHTRRSRAWAISAGFAFGYAALVNTLVILFPLVVGALLLASRHRGRLVAPFLLAFVALPASWWLATPGASTDAPGSLDRAAMNFVQGSWPQYHRAWQTRHDNAVSAWIMDSIDGEVEMILEDRRTGLKAVGARLAQEPGRTLRWYLLDKPWLLWDWDIQLGWHGIHFLPTTASPFESNPAMRAVRQALEAANPTMLALAVMAILALAGSMARGRPPPFPAVVTALFLVYVTLLHTLLQAEPRYAIAYRPAQLLMVGMALGLLASLMRRSKRTTA